MKVDKGIRISSSREELLPIFPSLQHRAFRGEL